MPAARLYWPGRTHCWAATCTTTWCAASATVLRGRACCNCVSTIAALGGARGREVDVARHLAEFWQTSHVPDEMEFRHDVQAAVDFIERAAPGVPLAMVGYSFGFALLSGIHTRAGLPLLVLIAPTVAKHDYDSFSSVASPLLVVSSDDDFATGAPELEDGSARSTCRENWYGSGVTTTSFEGMRIGLSRPFSSFWTGSRTTWRRKPRVCRSTLGNLSSCDTAWRGECRPQPGVSANCRPRQPAQQPATIDSFGAPKRDCLIETVV